MLNKCLLIALFSPILLQINEESSEGMPNTVCLNCLAELHSYTSFKRRSLAVNAKLREMVGKKRKLAEVYF